MKYVSAYLLLCLGGNDSPTPQDILNVIGSVGGDVDMENVHAVVSSLHGKSLDQVIVEGKKKMWTPSSGVAAAPMVVASATATAAAVPVKDEKKEESDSDASGMFAMFD